MKQVIHYLGSNGHSWFTGSFDQTRWTDDPVNATLFGEHDNPYLAVNQLAQQLNIGVGFFKVEFYSEAVDIFNRYQSNPTNWVKINYNGRTVYIEPEVMACMLRRAYGFDRMCAMDEIFQEVR